MEELDKAKKDLAEIRAKSGLPEDDAKPDFERLMEAEKAKMASAMRRAELLLAKAKRMAATGNTIWLYRKSTRPWKSCRPTYRALH